MKLTSSYGLKMLESGRIVHTLFGIEQLTAERSSLGPVVPPTHPPHPKEEG